MAKLKNYNERSINCNELMEKYSDIPTFENKVEEDDFSKKFKEIIKFSNKCLEEAKEIQAEIRDKKRKEEAMEGLYLEVYNFAEEEMPRIYKAMYKDEVLSFGTDFGKNYHKLVQKRREVVMENPGKIKLNGEIITNIPEINIIEVGV